MTITKITDVAAFAAKHAEFANTILFSEDEVPEVLPAEREGVDAAREHLLDVIVALLKSCREELWSRAAGTQARAMMEKNKNRDSSIRSRKRVDMGVLIESSYVETVYLWVDEEPTRPGVLSLVGEVGVQSKRREAIRKVAETDRLKRADDENLRVIGKPLTEGTELTVLAKDLADVLWPAALEVRQNLL